MLARVNPVFQGESHEELKGCHELATITIPASGDKFVLGAYVSMEGLFDNVPQIKTATDRWARVRGTCDIIVESSAGASASGLIRIGYLRDPNYSYTARDTSQLMEDVQTWGGATGWNVDMPIAAMQCKLRQIMIANPMVDPSVPHRKSAETALSTRPDTPAGYNAAYAGYLQFGVVQFPDVPRQLTIKINYDLSFTEYSPAVGVSSSASDDQVAAVPALTATADTTTGSVYVPSATGGQSPFDRILRYVFDPTAGNAFVPTQRFFDWLGGTLPLTVPGIRDVWANSSFLTTNAVSARPVIRLTDDHGTITDLPGAYDAPGTVHDVTSVFSASNLAALGLTYTSVRLVQFLVQCSSAHGGINGRGFGAIGLNSQIFSAPAPERKVEPTRPVPIPERKSQQAWPGDFVAAARPGTPDSAVYVPSFTPADIPKWAGGDTTWKLRYGSLREALDDILPR